MNDRKFVMNEFSCVGLYSSLPIQQDDLYSAKDPKSRQRNRSENLPGPHTVRPHTLRPIQYTPTPCALHPTSYTLHPTPYTLRPSQNDWGYEKSCRRYSSCLPWQLPRSMFLDNNPKKYKCQTPQNRSKRYSRTILA